MHAACDRRGQPFLGTCGDSAVRWSRAREATGTCPTCTSRGISWWGCKLCPNILQTFCRVMTHCCVLFAFREGGRGLARLMVGCWSRSSHTIVYTSLRVTSVWIFVSPRSAMMLCIHLTRRELILCSLPAFSFSELV